MSSRNGSKFSVVLNDKVRPCVELVEHDDGSLVVAAVVYGRTKEEAKARGELIQAFLEVDGALSHVRRRLRRIIWYHWAHKMHKQRQRRQHRNTNVFTLLLWLLQALIEPQRAGEWLAENFDTRDPFARVLRAEEVTLD